MRFALLTSPIAAARITLRGTTASFNSTRSSNHVDGRSLDESSIPTASANAARGKERETVPISESEDGRAARRKYTCGDRWTDAESEKLAFLVRNSLRETASPNWMKIAEHFPKRSKGSVVHRFYALQPGVRSQIQVKWTEGDVTLAMLLLRQRALVHALVRSLPGHSVPSIQALRSVLRKSPKGMVRPMESHEQSERTRYSDPMPRRHCTGWNDDDNELLKKLRKLCLQADWAYIGEMLGRTPNACGKRFSRLRRLQDVSPFPVPDIGECVSKKAKGVKWSEAEVRKLVACVTKSGDSVSWSALLDNLPGRSARACFAKWNRILELESFAGKWDGGPQ